MQNHYNLAYREEEREMIPLCLDQGVGVLPYSPLARGLLTGSRQRDGGGTTARSANDPLAEYLYGPDDFDVVDVLCEVARDLGRPPAQVALAWLRTRPGVTAPIVGATKLGHLEDALASLDLVLDDDVVARLEAPYRPHAVQEELGQERSRWLTASGENSWSTTSRVSPTTAASSPSAPSCRAMCRVARGSADR